MKKLVIITLILSLLIFSGCNEIQIQNDKVPAGTISSVNDSNQLEGPYSVVRVVDGDTIIIDVDGVEERIRLIGIDTPESVHPDAGRNVEYGKIASDYTKSMLEDQLVQIEYDVQERDKYGRLLGYIYLEGKMFNKTLLEEGHAKISTYPPNVKYVDDFKALQEQARENLKGVWSYESLSTTTSSATVSEQVTQLEAAYTGNSNTFKFHKSSCSSVDRINSTNLIYFNSSTEATTKGYVPCKICNP